jgi:hypothetical protein
MMAPNRYSGFGEDKSRSIRVSFQGLFWDNRSVPPGPVEGKGGDFGRACGAMQSVQRRLWDEAREIGADAASGCDAAPVQTSW